jgi:hypothetical protein
MHRPNNLCSSDPNDTNPPYSIDVMDKSLFYNVDTHEVTRAFLGPQYDVNRDPHGDNLYVDRFFTSQETTSVMLPLLHEENYHPRVLLCNAVQPLIADLAPTDPNTLQWAATASRQLIDPATRNPPVRFYASSVLLPTGDVIISGGVKTPGYDQSGIDNFSVKTVEEYRPSNQGQADSWDVGPDAHETRGYHSGALLMPDGRVWTAGSEWEWTKKVPATCNSNVAASANPVNIPVVSSTGFVVGSVAVIDTINSGKQESQTITAIPDGTHVTVKKLNNSHDGTTTAFPIVDTIGNATPNLAIELFEPYYYPVGDRVSITTPPPASVTYGQTLPPVQFTPLKTIARVVFMRCGSATHAFDGDQRYVSVPFTQTATSLTVTAPPDGTVAPPGYYMLWLVDGDNLPCKLAPFVCVG